jgi:hypothetical protein
MGRGTITGPGKNSSKPLSFEAVISYTLSNLANAHSAVQWREINTFFIAAVVMVSLVNVILFVSAQAWST